MAAPSQITAPSCVQNLMNSSSRRFDGTYDQCIIIQEKEVVYIPFEVQTFLRNSNRTQCQIHGEGKELLKCGHTDVYITPECVCSFYNVYEAKYHKYSSCPEGAGSDIVTQLKCSDCKKFSKNNDGPCINGGKLICKGEEKAPEVTCQCPPTFEGALCENKIEKITRICHRISIKLSLKLENCNSTWRECVTYSKNKRYAYVCQETKFSQKRQGLPLCLDTDLEITTEISSSETTQDKIIANANFGGRDIIFHVYLVLVVGIFGLFAGSCLTQIVWKHKDGKLTKIQSKYSDRPC